MTKCFENLSWRGVINSSKLKNIGEILESNNQIKKSLLFYRLALQGIGGHFIFYTRALRLSYWSNNNLYPFSVAHSNFDSINSTFFGRMVFEIKLWRSKFDFPFLRDRVLIKNDNLNKIISKFFSQRIQKTSEDIELIQLLSNYTIFFQVSSFFQSICKILKNNISGYRFSILKSFWITLTHLVFHKLNFKTQFKKYLKQIDVVMVKSRKIPLFLENIVLIKLSLNKISSVFKKKKFLGIIKKKKNWLFQFGQKLKNEVTNMPSELNHFGNIHYITHYCYAKMTRSEIKNISSYFSLPNLLKKKTGLIIGINSITSSLKMGIKTSALISIFIHFKTNYVHGINSLKNIFRNIVQGKKKTLDLELWYSKLFGSLQSFFNLVESMYYRKKMFSLHRFLLSFLFVFSDIFVGEKKPLNFRKTISTLKQENKPVNYFKSIFWKKNDFQTGKLHFRIRILELCEKCLIFSAVSKKNPTLDYFFSLCVKINSKLVKASRNKLIWLFLYFIKMRNGSAQEITRYLCAMRPYSSKAWSSLSKIEFLKQRNQSKILRFSIRMLIKYPDSVPVTIFTGNHCSAFGSHGYALGEFFQAFRYEINSPTLTLLIANQYLNGFFNRRNPGKGLSLILCMFFLSIYKNLRFFLTRFILKRRPISTKLTMEVYFNLGIVFWILGFREKSQKLLKIALKWKKTFSLITKQARFRKNYMNPTTLKIIKIYLQEHFISEEALQLRKL